MRFVIAAIVIAALAAPDTADAAFWDVELVYSDWFASGDASLAVGPSSVPSVSYSAGGSLYFAVRGVGEWNSQLVANVGFMGGFPSHAYNPAGVPCIAYVDASGSVSDYVRFAYRPSSTWITETVDSTGWMPDRLSLAFNPYGGAHIAYCKTTGAYPNLVHTIRVARKINNWIPQDVARVGGVTAPAMAISSSNTAYVAFCDPGTGELKVGSSSAGGPWSVETVDGSVSSAAVSYPAIAIQPNALPAVAYVVNLAGSAELRLACKTSGGWRIEKAASLQKGLSYNCAVCVEPSGIPFIAYQDPANSTFRNAWKHGGAWLAETVDEAPGTGVYPSLRLDSLGNIDAAYYDSGNSAVKFAWAAAPKDLAAAKTGPEGSWVQISGLIAANVQGEAEGSSTPRVYAQMADRRCGIALYHGPAGVARGDILDVYGTLYTDNGERVLYNTAVSLLGSTQEPKPLAMVNAALGGGGWHYSPGPPETGQRGVSGGTGLNNIGLLVRTWGRFTYVNPYEFIVDDGSGAPVRCRMPTASASPAWNYVGVTGLSSCTTGTRGLERVLRVRSLSDIVVVF